MLRLLPVVLLAVTLVACGGEPPRAIAFHYMKVGASEAQVYRDKERIASHPGVQRVLVEYDRDGTGRLHIFALEGQEGKVLELVESLGYSRAQ